MPLLSQVSCSERLYRKIEKVLGEVIKETTNNRRSLYLDMTYRGIDIQKPDADRPKDTKMVTVKVDLKSFYSKNSLLRDTGELSTSLFQAVYDVPSIQAYDVIVWYYAETTDRYGNKKNDVVLTYFIDKPTHSKINWQNFDKKAACDFLEQEAKVTGTMDTGCKTLVNIQ